MCISHLSSFNLTALTKVSSMIKRSVRFEFGIPMHSWQDNFIPPSCFRRGHLNCRFYLELLIVCFPGVSSFFTYRYVKAKIWIHCCWLGNLGSRCPVIHKDRGKRSARRYKRGRWVLASGNRSSDQEACHVRRRSIGSVWWVHVRFIWNFERCVMFASISFSKLETSTQIHATWKHDRIAEKEACPTESTQLNKAFSRNLLHYKCLLTLQVISSLSLMMSPAPRSH